MQSINSSLYGYVSPSSKKSEMIAGFDLDWTLIRPELGKFPKASNDFVFMKNRISFLQYYQRQGYLIAIFTNQKVTKRFTLAKRIERLNLVISAFEQYEIHPYILMAVKDDEYRKPQKGMWCYLNQYNFVNHHKSFYCGDAAGPNDFSDSDYLFATEIPIPFYLPEQIFEFQPMTS